MICNEHKDAIIRAHDHLHAGRHDEAHEILHKLVNGDPIDMEQIPEDQKKFDEGFRRLCQETGVEAAYFRFKEEMRVLDQVRVRILTGGHARTNAILDRMLDQVTVRLS